MIIKNVTSRKILARNAWESRFLGLMFKKLRKGEACVLKNPYNDRLGAGIHMFFVPQELDVLWLDEKGVVVDKKHCKRWRLYFPEKSASYVVELLDAGNTKINDEIRMH